MVPDKNVQKVRNWYLTEEHFMKERKTLLTSQFCAGLAVLYDFASIYSIRNNGIVIRTKKHGQSTSRWWFDWLSALFSFTNFFVTIRKLLTLSLSSSNFSDQFQFHVPIFMSLQAHKCPDDLNFHRIDITFAPLTILVTIMILFLLKTYLDIIQASNLTDALTDSYAI